MDHCIQFSVEPLEGDVVFCWKEGFYVFRLHISISWGLMSPNLPVLSLGFKQCPIIFLHYLPVADKAYNNVFVGG